MKPSLIRCCLCGKGKGIFQPWNRYWFCKDCYKYGPLVQLDRTIGYGPIGWGFEFSVAHQQKIIRVAIVIRYLSSNKPEVFQAMGKIIKKHQ